MRPAVVSQTSSFSAVAWKPVSIDHGNKRTWFTEIRTCRIIIIRLIGSLEA
jgi:hypothetical protein